VSRGRRRGVRLHEWVIARLTISDARSFFLSLCPSVSGPLAHRQRQLAAPHDRGLRDSEQQTDRHIRRQRNKQNNSESKHGPVPVDETRPILSFYFWPMEMFSGASFGEGGWRGLWTPRIVKCKNFALPASSNNSLYCSHNGR